VSRLGQILDVAVRYELITHNPVKTRVKKLKDAEPRRARMTGEQVQTLRAAGRNRALLPTAIMAGGLRASELAHLRSRDLNLAAGQLHVATSKTAAGIRSVTLEPELVKLQREHRVASRWSQDDDFVFPGRIRTQPRERNRIGPQPREDTMVPCRRGAGTRPRAASAVGRRRTRSAPWAQGLESRVWIVNHSRPSTRSMPAITRPR